MCIQWIDLSRQCRYYKYWFMVTLIRGLWVFITTYCTFQIDKSVQFVLVLFRFLIVIIFLSLHSGTIYDDIIIICCRILICLSQVQKSTKKGIMRSKTKIEYIYIHRYAIYCIIIKPIFIVSTLSRYIYPLDTHLLVQTCVAQSYYLVICWIHEDKHHN